MHTAASLWSTLQCMLTTDGFKNVHTACSPSTIAKIRKVNPPSCPNKLLSMAWKRTPAVRGTAGNRGAAVEEAAASSRAVVGGTASSRVVVERVGRCRHQSWKFRQKKTAPEKLSPALHNQRNWGLGASPAQSSKSCVKALCFAVHV